MYLDSSAIVKLVVREAETGALVDALGPKPPAVSSSLARVEVLRSARRTGMADVVSRAQEVLAGVALLGMDQGVLSRAAELHPVELRTLDAIHLATALTLGGDLEGFVTYDRRLREAASREGLPVLEPGG
ncbi:MAG: type II toxin-antitoxin system VapC family toxin [Actinobacteria bacterium]|nr:type II toxin-antitoxin system VapC family toxin [Actinomycetota bacterium]